MGPIEIGILALLAMVVLIYSGVHVAIALAATSYIGVWLVRDSQLLAGRLLAIAAEESISSYIFGVVPLFVLMGMVVSEAELGKDAFDVAARAFKRVAGGLGIATVAANAVFAAITGISIASAAVFTRIAVPEMRRAGYTPRFAVGVVAGSSVLGMLLPPSLLLILYAVLAEESIGRLFIAGILPGILLAVVYSIFIAFMAVYNKRWVGDVSKVDLPPLSRREVLVKLLPTTILIIIVLGGIYGGIFTPTEAGAVGALGAIIIAAIRGRLPWRKLWKITVETGQISAAVLFLIIAASMYSRMLALTGVPQAMTNWLTGGNLGITVFIIGILLIAIVLGTILDSSSIMLILVPLALPVLTTFGVDLIWFGILITVAIEIGLLTPPLGLSVYVIHATLRDRTVSMNDVFMGTLPFALVMLAVLAILFLFPWFSVALI
ncbi:MAG: TRAP transporter large permease [Actinobacteria bacterium]|nr:TRAP transporter large permease [Actinomycetota bacterium]